jgi:hypothetical protein
MIRDSYSALLPMHGTELAGPYGTWRMRFVSAREWPQGLDYHFRLELRNGDREQRRDIWMLVSRERLEEEAGQIGREYLKAIAERIRYALRTGESELDCRRVGQMELAAPA